LLVLVLEVHSLLLRDSKRTAKCAESERGELLHVLRGVDRWWGSTGKICLELLGRVW
jgi:hypothetical protein